MELQIFLYAYHLDADDYLHVEALIEGDLYIHAELSCREMKRPIASVGHQAAGGGHCR